MSEQVIDQVPPVEEPPVPPVDPPPEPPAEPQEPETPPAAAAEGEPEPKKGGMLAELITERRKRQELEARLEQVSQRLSTVEQPRHQEAAQERERAALIETAKELNLVTTDPATNQQVWDLEAAKRAHTWGTRIARQAAAEVVQPVQRFTMNGAANAHVNEAVAFARQHGLPEEGIKILEDTYRSALGQANGAELVADPNVAQTIYFQGIGRAAAAGHVMPTKKAQPAPGGGGPPIQSPATGRRAPAAALQLPPAAAKVYAEAGIDPANTAHTFDAKGAAILKD